MSVSWFQFLSELELRQGQEAVIQFECRGAFLKFRSRLAKVERSSPGSVETMSMFGVVPHHITLSFSNGVKINLYMRHIEEVSQRGKGVCISFKGEDDARNSIVLFPGEHRGEGRAG